MKNPLIPSAARINQTRLEVAKGWGISERLKRWIAAETPNSPRVPRMSEEIRLISGQPGFSNPQIVDIESHSKPTGSAGIGSGHPLPSRAVAGGRTTALPADTAIQGGSMAICRLMPSGGDHNLSVIELTVSIAASTSRPS
jgi:hypothetical protein